MSVASRDIRPSDASLVPIDLRTSWDAALNALVTNAWTARGTSEFLSACRRIVEAHNLWPLVEANRELDRARREMAEQDARTATLVALLRSTYPGPAADAP